MTPEEEIWQLRLDLSEHNKAYYLNDAPVISDEEYDAMFQRLQALEKQYPEYDDPTSPTHIVGGFISTKFKPVKHSVPMISIRTETDYSAEGALKFVRTVCKELGHEEAEYVAELKFDGLALNLKYFRGKLVQAATRGDHEVGEDVTHTAMTIEDIPKVLTNWEAQRHGDIVEVRGEAYMPLSVFREVNKKRLSKGEKLFVNPRNAAAGSIRQDDPKITAERQLKFFAYGLVQRFEHCKGQADNLHQLYEFGFQINTLSARLRTGEELANFHKEIEEIRSTFDFDIDGVVYKVDKFEHQDQLGSTAREPRWAVAHKYRPQEARTRVNGMRLEVGRTGNITPVATLDPVYVGGVTVTNATLHNQPILDKLGVNIGDIVTVRRAGDVVPEIVAVVEKGENEGSYKILKASPNCPVCNTGLVRYEGEADTYCPGGFDCIAQRKRSLEHFCSKKALNIKGVGEALIGRLIDANLVTYPHDLYKLTAQTLMSVLGLGPVESKNAIDAIQASASNAFWRVLHGLGIHCVGEVTARKLSVVYHDFSSLTHTSQQDLMAIDDIGPITSQAIANFFASENGKRIVQGLQSVGFSTFAFESVKHIESQFNGKNIVVTGKFEGYTRDQIEERIQDLGGHPNGNVSSKTDFLFCGEEAGSKLERAEKLGIAILRGNEVINRLW
jgi:DNA ligase (NAD+)